MLRRLSIRDFLLIDKLDMEFGPGLTVFTGETGTGKSILLEALGLALGDRAAAGLAARGARRAQVSAVFHPGDESPAHALSAEHGLEADGAFILRRTIAADGRSRAFVNDSPVGIGLLKRIGDSLVEIEGRNAAGGLLDGASHLGLLDAFAGHEGERAALAESHAGWRAAEAALSEAREGREAAHREEAYLRHAVAELEALAPESGEEERCAAERARLLNGQKLAEALDQTASELAAGGGVAARLRAAYRAVERAAPLAGGGLDALREALDRAAIEADEADAAFAEAARAVEAEPGRLEAVEERLFALRAAARKHRVEPDELGGLLARLRGELDRLDEGEGHLAALERAARAAEEAFRRLAHALSRARETAAAGLEAAIAAELGPLKLGHARFGVALERMEDAASREGIDRCRFMLATAPGADLAPLERIASGGERARLMLALRVRLARAAGLSTLVFDEIDRGIGGAVADAVGVRLAGIAEAVQVLLVTHSPQVAARGDVHFRVARRDRGENAGAEVERLTGERRREEIARMLSGARITEEARAAAESLMQAG